MFKKSFKKSADKTVDPIQVQAKSLERELVLKDALINSAGEGFNAAIWMGLDFMVTGGTFTVLLASLWGASTILKPVSSHATKTWTNSAGQKVQGKKYMYDALGQTDEFLRKQLKKYDTTEDEKVKIKIKSSIEDVFKKFYPLAAQVKIIEGITEESNEPFFFQVKRKSGEIEMVAFTSDAFNHPLSNLEKLKARRDQGKGFGI